MTLAIDIGNSNIVVAIDIGSQWLYKTRFETKEKVPSSFYEQWFRNIFLEWGVTASSIHQVVISSVVPDLNESIKQSIHYVTGQHPLVVDPDIIKALDIHIPHPYEIGSDLVANAYAGIKKYQAHCIVVDFGTALTFTIANKDDGILGVTIAPGLKTAVSSLSSETAQLPTVPILMPDSAIGTNTTTAIQSGIMWGYVGLVKQLISKIKQELDAEYKVIATGGLVTILTPLLTEYDIIAPDLTLDGLKLIYEYTKKK